MDKIWLNRYLSSVPPGIDPGQYTSLADLFLHNCRAFKNKPAFTQLGLTLTYSELEKYTRYFAAYLQQVLKLKKSERIVLMLPNSFQFVIAFFASLRLGLV